MTLACDDKHVNTHKFVISSFSPVLKSILRKTSNQHPFIFLRGVKYKDLLNILNFMYQGEVNIVQEELNSFLTTAEDLKIRGLYETEKSEGLSSTVTNQQYSQTCDTCIW